MKAKLTVLSSDGDRVLFADSGERVLDVLDAAGISVYAPCGGAGICGGCRAKITGKIECDPREADFLCENDTADDIHLMCMTRISGDAEIDLRGRGITAETDGIASEYVLSPLSEGKYGIAVDIGTTTVAVYLCSLCDGKIIAAESMLNPQSSYGADVISRIDAVNCGRTSLECQRKAVISAINEKTARLCERAGTAPDEISAAAVCGNTVMEHFLCGLDPSGIAVYPFTPKSLFGETVTAEKLGLEIQPKAPVLISPCVASYVGGDISCGFSVLPEYAGDFLYIDIGTNGEEVLSRGGRLYACSAAAGPALEGARLSRGMAGETGAVCRVCESDGEIICDTIKNAPPRGICGSGAIDALAAARRLDAVDETGRMIDGEYTENIGGERAFIIDKEHGIYLTQSDVRQIQLAKAAICAGAKTLADMSGAALSEIKIIVAGGFGAHIDASSAVEIGLLPRTDMKNISFVGNAAGMGAAGLLLSGDIRRKASEFCRVTEYIELSQSKIFAEHYIDEMGF